METKTIYLRSEDHRDYAIEYISGVDIDSERPITVVVKPYTSSRTREQNNYYWACLSNISEQVFLDGKSYNKDVWNDYFKRSFLPSEDCFLTKPNYKKWSAAPDGNQVLCGSTTDLTLEGMQRYLDDVIKFAAEHNVVMGDI